MLNPALPSGTIGFLSRLRKIDMRSLTSRDVLVLYAVIQKPGQSGLEISSKLGIPDRSGIASNIWRLIREGYIEDRRLEHKKAVPAILHPLPKGIEFWDEIKPQG